MISELCDSEYRLQSRFLDPNPNSPANSAAVQLFKENQREYENCVKACVEDSWCDEKSN